MRVTTDLIVNNFEWSASNERNPKTSRLQEYYPTNRPIPARTPKYADMRPWIRNICPYFKFTVCFCIKLHAP